MNIVSLKQEDMTEYGIDSECRVISAHVIVNDVDVRAKEMIETIASTSWLDDLGAVEKATFRARSKRTIEKLVGLIVSRVENEVSVEFGEFMISESAQTALNQSLDHTKVPLAELLKEKVSGNPGFDFHTETTTQLISFGEAKYSGVGNPYSNAINQIVDFIELEKDSAELLILQSFVSSEAVENSLKGNKAYIAAFSINAKDPNTIIRNALKSDSIKPLLLYPELYVIGIEVHA